jgi:acetyl esterase/lipase
VGASEGAAVLDLVRAARRLPTGAGRRVLVAGHSQGGHAALFAGEMAAAYAPELRVLGIAPGAPVSDVRAFLAHASTRPALTGFVVMGALGYAVAYPELADAPVLTPAAATKANLALEACAGDVLLAFAADDPAEVFRAAPAGTPAWTRRLEENRAGMRPAGAPLLVWQGAADDLVPAALTADFVARVCPRGGAVDYREYPGADHATVLAAARDDVLAFFAARVRGDRPASTCATAGTR